MTDPVVGRFWLHFNQPACGRSDPESSSVAVRGRVAWRLLSELIDNGYIVKADNKKLERYARRLWTVRVDLDSRDVAYVDHRLSEASVGRLSQQGRTRRSRSGLVTA